MKRFNFLHMAAVASLLVAIASCTPMRDISDDYYNDGPVTRRHVYADQYYGNAPVILQRDPYTGMYYEVSPYGYYPGTVYPPYNSRYYNNNDRYYNNRRNDNYRNGNNDTYQNNRNNQSNQNSSGATQQNNDYQQKRQEARDKILGERR